MPSSVVFRNKKGFRNKWETQWSGKWYLFIYIFYRYVFATFNKRFMVVEDRFKVIKVESTWVPQFQVWVLLHMSTPRGVLISFNPEPSMKTANLRIKCMWEELSKHFGVTLWFSCFRCVEDNGFLSFSQSFTHQFGGEFHCPKNTGINLTQYS